MPADRHSDMSRDTVSLTYQELAERLGIDVQSARRRALRSGWPKSPGNDGKARVNVPATALSAVGATKATPTPHVLSTEPTAVAPVAATPQALSHLLSQAAELPELRERLGRAEAEAAALREALGQEAAARQAAEARAAAVEAATAVERSRADRAEAEGAALREGVARETTARQAAEARADQADAARRAAEVELGAWTGGGPLAQAWRAFRWRR
jgi:hypothetical protein